MRQIFLQYFKLNMSMGLILSTILLAGCASHQAVPSCEEQLLNSDENKQLSQGKVAKVETSQGSITIEPTVVDMDCGQDSADASSIYYDPLESINRAVFSFNHASYTYVLIPVAKGYEFLFPVAVRSKVSNAFSNIREPINALSNLFSGEGKKAGQNTARFLINSTLGIFGLFDPADAWFDIKPAEQSIADMLASHDIDPGAYIVLPLLGQSDLRGAGSVITEGLIHPVRHLTNTPETYYIQGTNAFTSFSERADLYETLYEQASDPYIYFRNQYIQGVERDAAYAPR